MKNFDYHYRVQNFHEKVKSAVIGFAVGDALGVPVEFSSRDDLAAEPVTDMRSGGTHGQPAGTWSDDTSMTLCVMQSLIDKGFDFDDQMKRFEDWLWNASNTAHDEVFDVGNTTRSTVFKFAKGTPALECGDAFDWSCGNGSLMRMLPTALYIVGKYQMYPLIEKTAELIHDSSRITHAHPRCLMACGIYCNVLFQMSGGGYLPNAVHFGILEALSYYKKQPEFAEYIDEFESLSNILKLDESEISGKGYVIDTLKAALWCLVHTDGYADCVLKAVNLGDDTDTTAAIAGSLAGFWYPYSSIPVNWLEVLAKREEIEKLCKRFAYACREDVIE